jgi:PAS domain-containing protein
LDPSGYVPCVKKYQELIHPEDWEELDATLGDSIKNQDDSNFQMFGTQQGVTELKRAEISLQKANEYLTAILNAIPGLLFVVDTQGIILDYRSQKKKLLYAPPQDFLNKSKPRRSRENWKPNCYNLRSWIPLVSWAGGIAHDFNNQLSGIMGYAELISPELNDETLMRYAVNIMQGAKNGANLTQLS